MALIVLDGPSGVGKTYHIEMLRKAMPVHRVWDWTVMRNAIGTRKFEAIMRDTMHAISNDQTVIVEGSWASDSLIYELANPRYSQPTTEFFAEWQFGRLAQFCGLRIMMLAPSSVLSEMRRQQKLRTATAVERAVFANYAERWNWLILHNEFIDENVLTNVEKIIKAEPKKLPSLDSYPGYCGPRDAPIVFVTSTVGEELNLCTGRFLPFSSDARTRFGGYFGRSAMLFGWASARRIAPTALRSARVLVADDEAAELWCSHHVNARDVRRLPNMRTMVAQIKKGERLEILDSLLAERLKLEHLNT